MCHCPADTQRYQVTTTLHLRSSKLWHNVAVVTFFVTILTLSQRSRNIELLAGKLFERYIVQNRSLSLEALAKAH